MLFEDLDGDGICLIAECTLLADAGRLSLASKRFYGVLHVGVERRLALHHKGLRQLVECLGRQAVDLRLQRNAIIKLTSPSFARCSIGSPGAAEIAKFMSRNELLTHLNLWGNNIRDEGAKAIGEALCVNRALTFLCLRQNGIEDEGAAALGKALEVNGALTTLSLSANCISDEGAAAIAKALRGNKTLIALNISDNYIRDEGAAAIAEALNGNKVLSYLNLANNNIGGTGWIKASDVEGETAKVGATVIYEGREMVVSVGLDSDGDMQLVHAVQMGVVTIAKALEVNMVLEHLDLGKNVIGDEAAKAIGGALAVNKALTELRLGANRIGGEGAKALASALRVNQVLTKLVLWCNPLGKEGKGVNRDAVSGRVGPIALTM